MNTENKSRSTHKLSARKFVGIWAIAGFIVGVILGTPNPGDMSSMIANRIGTGIPFALVGAALGAAIQYFFRSDER